MIWYVVHARKAKIDGRAYTRLDSAHRGIKREKLRQVEEHGIVITHTFWIIPTNGGVHREG